MVTRIRTKTELTEAELYELIRKATYSVIKDLLAIKQDAKRGYSEGFNSSVTYKET